MTQELDDSRAAYSTSPHDRKGARRAVLSSFLGSTIEFYDFLL
jgi:hypothetical protein